MRWALNVWCGNVVRSRFLLTPQEVIVTRFAQRGNYDVEGVGGKGVRVLKQGV